ncbi:hypothetical protein DERF_013910 [Dermatophagoides farinae]|uniref:Uncharacterized protein n=1 Tax=Dermatophagoides farinae TaxID=6954 RepID=A0A922HQH6_DERFA|nr:hypothetical protein DERF_013910 [Dermatophagoides farinae]
MFILDEHITYAMPKADNPFCSCRYMIINVSNRIKLNFTFSKIVSNNHHSRELKNSKRNLRFPANVKSN